MTILLAVIIGGLFGFVLQRAGAGDADEIINMLTFNKVKVIKSIILGIIVGSAILFVSLSSSQLLVSLLSIKAVYWGVPIGVLFLGIGWAVSGVCPGAALSSLTKKRKDSVYFVLGALIGAAFFTVFYENLLSPWLLSEVFGEAMLLNDSGTYDASLEGSGVLVATIITVLFMFGSMYAPQNLEQKLI